MISIRKYLDGSVVAAESDSAKPDTRREETDLVAHFKAAYRSALAEMVRAGSEACPVLGPDLDRKLLGIADSLGDRVTPEILASADRNSRAGLHDWGLQAARHYRQKAGEVKEILLVMARTAESVGERDQRCAKQISEVTANLKSISSLDDLSQIRSSIERSASELKNSIERMTAEGRAVLDRLHAQVSAFQAKLEEAEEIASSDGLTRLRSRLWVETHIEQKVKMGATFCVAVLDLDGFKAVNDRHGHLAGDAVLQQFAQELRLACRKGDVVGRWGGDEFLVVLDCDLSSARAQMERVSKWVCGSYTVRGESAPLKLRVDASIGLAEFAPPQTMKQLLDSADAAMYRSKAGSRAAR